jgi:hypothetical protein
MKTIDAPTLATEAGPFDVLTSMRDSLPETATVRTEEIVARGTASLSTKPATVVTTSTTERIMDAYAVAMAYMDQIEDPGHQEHLRRKLTRSNVGGSWIAGLEGPDDVVALLSGITELKEISTALEDSKITVFEGLLPVGRKASAGYASLREIFAMYGQAGLGTVQAKEGYQKPNQFYLCSLLGMPTRVVTIQLKKDASGTEHFHMFFAGQELSSRIVTDDGEFLVRMNSVILPVEEQRRKKERARGGSR